MMEHGMECVDQSGQKLCCVHTLSSMHEKALKPFMKYEGSAQPVHHSPISSSVLWYLSIL